MDRLLGDLQPGVLSELIGPIAQAAQGPARVAASTRPRTIARRIRILAIGSRKVEPAHFRVLSTALAHAAAAAASGTCVARTATCIEREVSPQRLVHYRDNWYLDAWCHTRQALRTFGVDAIESGERGRRSGEGRSTTRRSTAISRAATASSPDADTQEAVLQFGASNARAGSRARPGIPKQDGRLQPTARYLLQLPYSQEPELVMDVLKYGADVEVLAPARCARRSRRSCAPPRSSTTDLTSPGTGRGRGAGFTIRLNRTQPGPLTAA